MRSDKNVSAHAHKPRFSDGRRHGNLHHWNGQRMSLQQGTSHTSLEWTDGDDWAGSFPYFEERSFPWSPPTMEDCPTLQNGQMDVPPAGNLPYFNEMDRWR